MDFRTRILRKKILDIIPLLDDGQIEPTRVKELLQDAIRKDTARGRKDELPRPRATPVLDVED